MKYLPVTPINIARDDQFRAQAYPGDGVYVPSTGIGLVVVLAGHVWRGPDGAQKMVREMEEGGSDRKPPEISMASEVGRVVQFPPDPAPPYPTPYEETVLIEDLRRWAIEQSVKVAAEGEHWLVVEARARAMVEWVKKKEATEDGQ